jgi:hypothetical protein
MFDPFEPFFRHGRSRWDDDVSIVVGSWEEQAACLFSFCPEKVPPHNSSDMTSWFHELVGFPESSWEETRATLEVDGERLRSKVTDRSFAIGTFEMPNVRELRERASAHLERVKGKGKVSAIIGEAGALHRDPTNAGALFQVASQFNLLEMIAPTVTPEHGVTRYANDRTQGPACAIAAGAATIYRNYFVPVDGNTGQTASRQIDCLRDLGAFLGNEDGSLWEMKNGYALLSSDGWRRTNETLGKISAPAKDALRDRLRIGIHWDAEVTTQPGPGSRVSQALCSALPLGGYSDVESGVAAAFATLILEGAYEATMWAAVINAARTGNNTVFLTHVGGGAFGNESDWIAHAIERAVHLVENASLDIRIVHYGKSALDLRPLRR